MRDESRVSVGNASEASNVVSVNRGASRVTGQPLPRLFPRLGSGSSLERNSYSGVVENTVPALSRRERRAYRKSLFLYSGACKLRSCCCNNSTCIRQ